MTLLIVDANIMISALLGRSLPLLADQAARGIILAAPVAQFGETRNKLQSRNAPGIEDKMAALLQVVQPLEPVLFDDLEPRARERLEKRGQPDWPVLAAAMALDGAIWSHDRDFFGVGVAVWSNANVKHVEATAG